MVLVWVGKVRVEGERCFFFSFLLVRLCFLSLISGCLFGGAGDDDDDDVNLQRRKEESWSC